MEKLYSGLCQWIVLHTHYINFLIFTHFTNQITLKQSLAQRLKPIFKFSSIKRHKYSTLDPLGGIKTEERMEKLL